MQSANRQARKLKTEEVARDLKVSPATLRQWRSRGVGPAFLRLGRAIRYDSVDIAQYLGSRRVAPSNEATPTSCDLTVDQKLRPPQAPRARTTDVG